MYAKLNIFLINITLLLIDTDDSLHVVDVHDVAEDIETKPATSRNKKQKVTIDEINEVHLQVVKLEKEKLECEIENVLLAKKKLLLEIEEIEIRKSKLLHDS